MSRPRLSTVLAYFLLLALQSGVAQNAAPAEFSGLAQWKCAVLPVIKRRSNSCTPPMLGRSDANGKPQEISAETQFWQEFLARKHHDVQVLVRGTKEQNGLRCSEPDCLLQNQYA